MLFQSLSHSEECQGRERAELEKGSSARCGGEEKRGAGEGMEEPQNRRCNGKESKIGSKITVLGYKKSAEHSAAEAATPGRRKE